MKNKLKKVTTALMVMVLCIALPLTAFAVSESEDNNTVATADTINVNEWVYGTVLNGNDTDYYKVTIPSNGYVQINLKHEYGKGYAWAYLNTYDGSTEKEYMHMYSPSDSEETTSKKMGIEKGTYYVKIDGSALEYNFQVNFTSTNSWETEFNDNVSKADDFSLGSKKNGVISDNSDKDYYKISVPSSGKYNVALEHAYKDSGSFNVAVCSYD